MGLLGKLWNSVRRMAGTRAATAGSTQQATAAPKCKPELERLEAREVMFAGSFGPLAGMGSVFMAQPTFPTAHASFQPSFGPSSFGSPFTSFGTSLYGAGAPVASSSMANGLIGGVLSAPQYSGQAWGYGLGSQPQGSPTNLVGRINHAALQQALLRTLPAPSSFGFGSVNTALTPTQVTNLFARLGAASAPSTFHNPYDSFLSKLNVAFSPVDPRILSTAAWYSQTKGIEWKANNVARQSQQQLFGEIDKTNVNQTFGSILSKDWSYLLSR